MTFRRLTPIVAALYVAFVPHECFAASSSATISLAPATVAWANLGYNQTAQIADNTIIISGNIKTSNGGSGSIVVGAPSSLAGTNGAPLNIAGLSVTCSGSAIAGQTYVASMTPLTPGGTVTCATYGSKFNAAISITATFYINDIPVYVDTYGGGNVFYFLASAA